MANPRFFLSERLADPTMGSSVALPLSEEDLHHAANVLRVLPSEYIEVVTTDSLLYLARVISVSKTQLEVKLLEPLVPPFEPAVTLVQGVSKGERMELCIRMAVEVGVHSIVPVLSSRSIVKLDSKKRLERVGRWTRIAHAAAKQSGRITIPQVAAILTSDELEEMFSGFDLVLVAWEECRGPSIREAVQEAAVTTDRSVAIVIGPEGGFTPEEVGRFNSWGARCVTLGDTILRTETAGVVAAALLIAEMGGLGYGRQ